MVSAGQRVLAGLLAAACLAVLVTAASLHPLASGHGTHTELGLPPCGWAMALNRPCPTCGMTTAFAYAAHLDAEDSVLTQPMGALLALATAAGFWGAAHVAVLGRRGDVLLGPLLRPRVLWLGAGLWAASWIYKMIVWHGGSAA